MAAISALFQGGLTGPSPVDRARTGSKHHLLTDAGGVPLGISLTGGHRNDVTQLLPLVDGVEPVRGRVGRPRKRAERLQTAATTTTSTVARCAREASNPRSPAAAASTAPVSGASAGWWSALSPGCTTCAGSGRVTSARASCTWHSCCWAARWSASGCCATAEPHSSPSKLSRPYWSGIQPHPQIATGRAGISPYSSTGSAFSDSTTQL